jgi:N4-gp56 family major capsid protein
MALTDAAALNNLIETAYDTEVEFLNRNTPFFAELASKKVEKLAMPGDVITLSIHGDLAAATTPLTDGVDVTATALPDVTRVSLTLEEYGAAAVSTLRAHLTSFSSVDSQKANQLARQMHITVDDLAQTALRAGTNVYREISGAISTAAATGILGTDKIRSPHVRLIKARLSSGNALPTRGEQYAAYIHGDVAHDLLAETGGVGWTDFHKYVGSTNVWRGEVGTYNGVAFIESPRCHVAREGSGSGGTQIKVYKTYFMGQQALAYAAALEPQVVVSMQTDLLKRNFGLGWKAMLAFKVFRQTALYRLETTSSIAEL